VIVVDTSIWVDAERKPDSDDADTLRALLRADEVARALPVRIELVTGVSAKNRRALRRGLSSLPVIRPTEDTWNLLESWVPRAADAGHHFKVADLLIGALAEEMGALIWSHDKDFATMEELGFVHLYEPA
jgi:predicted nucleic acid-binding protein